MSTRDRKPDDPDLAAARVAMWAESENPQRIARLVEAIEQSTLTAAERCLIITALSAGDPDAAISR